MTNQAQRTEKNDLATLGVKVGVLENDIREVNDRLLGLDTKIDKAVASIATEFRASLATVMAQLSERQRTPWGVLISGAGFIVAVLGLYGSQALAPIQSDLKTLKTQIVPREEINYRADVTNRRFMALETAIEADRVRRYEEMRDEMRDLRNENRELKRSR